MDVLEFCKKVEDVLDRLNPETLSDWEWGATSEKDDLAHVIDAATTCRETRSAFLLPEKTAMQGVFVKGADIKLAVCGNSPSAAARAQFIAAMSPTNVRILIAHIRKSAGGTEA